MRSADEAELWRETFDGADAVMLAQGSAAAPYLDSADPDLPMPHREIRTVGDSVSIVGGGVDPPSVLGGFTAPPITACTVATSGPWARGSTCSAARWAGAGRGPYLGRPDAPIPAPLGNLTTTGSSTFDLVR